MKRNRITLTVEVDLDPIPGTWHDAESVKAALAYMLKTSVEHYNPTVVLTEWSCGNCDWAEKAHPYYGWEDHHTGAVQVHQTMLCPSLPKEKS